jgi:plasmid stabilization system protein ParE
VLEVIWAPRALAAFRREKKYLEERRAGWGILFEGDIASSLRHLAQHTFAGRAVVIGELRIWSLPRWRKILIYRATDAAVEIVALPDTRQNR